MYKDAFPGLELEEEEENVKEVTEDDFEIFYLWDENDEIYQIFKIVSDYLLEYYVIDSTILIELIKDAKLPLRQSLTYIAYIRSGYRNILSARTDNGDKDT